MSKSVLRVVVLLLCLGAAWSALACSRGSSVLIYSVTLVLFGAFSEVPAKLLSKRPLINLVVAYLYATVFFMAVLLVRMVLAPEFPQSACIDVSSWGTFWLVAFCYLLCATYYLYASKKSNAFLWLQGLAALFTLYLFAVDFIRLI